MQERAELEAIEREESRFDGLPDWKAKLLRVSRLFFHIKNFVLFIVSPGCLFVSLGDVAQLLFFLFFLT